MAENYFNQLVDNSLSDDELFMRYVVNGDADLLFLDACLVEAFSMS